MCGKFNITMYLETVGLFSLLHLRHLQLYSLQLWLEYISVVGIY